MRSNSGPSTTVFKSQLRVETPISDLILGRNTLLFKSKNNKCDTKRKPRTQGLREVTNCYLVFTALAWSGPDSRKTKLN